MVMVPAQINTHLVTEWIKGKGKQGGQKGEKPWTSKFPFRGLNARAILSGWLLYVGWYSQEQAVYTRNGGYIIILSPYVAQMLVTVLGSSTDTCFKATGGQRLLIIVHHSKAQKGWGWPWCMPLLPSLSRVEKGRAVSWKLPICFPSWTKHASCL